MSPKKNAPDFGDRTLSPSGWQGWRERQNPRHGTLHQLKHAERRWATKPSSTYEKNLKKVDKAVVWKRTSFLICCKYPMFCWCLKHELSYELRPFASPDHGSSTNRVFATGPSDSWKYWSASSWYVETWDGTKVVVLDDLYRNLKEEEEEEKVLLKSERNRETTTVVLRRLPLNFQLGHNACPDALVRRLVTADTHSPHVVVMFWGYLSYLTCHHMENPWVLRVAQTTGICTILMWRINQKPNA